MGVEALEGNCRDHISSGGVNGDMTWAIWVQLIVLLISI